MVCTYMSFFFFKQLHFLLSKLCLIFSDNVPEFDVQWAIRKKVECLIMKLQKKAEQHKKHFAVFIDEMPLSFFEGQDYEDLLVTWQIKYPQVYLFLAISPSGRALVQPVELIFQCKEKVYAKQLLTRHRNSFLLSTFLIHLTYNYIRMKPSGSNTFQCLSPEMDVALDPSMLPKGEITLWYNKSENISDLEILQFLHKTYLPEDGQVLVSPLQQDLSQSVYDWCLAKKWDIVSHGNMTGSERDLVIAFADNKFGNLEILSRARKQLIIITRYFVKQFESKTPET